MDFRFLTLLGCFFASGFVALLYQTAWTREFSFLFGTSELAVVAVLAAYMGGLALGAAVAARWVGRLRRPVLAYGLLELGIALGALAVPLLIRGLQGVYVALFGGLEAPPDSLALGTALFHLVGSFLVLLPCTGAMGATLPLLARHAVVDDAQVGPRVGLLYAVNTAGAIAGTLAAAFVLLPAIGLRATVYVGIAGNALVFIAAAGLARSLPEVAPIARPSGARPGDRFHWVLPAMTVSGAVSFLDEVLWTRMLGQVLGGSTAAFASMLASFLLGIALGSALASRFATRREGATLGFALVQLGAGVLGWIAFRSADLLPELMRRVGASASDPAAGAAIAGLVLLPLTLCIGATFPFAVRMVARDAEDAAAVSGRVYAWNTVGSIVGATLAGFFLLPLLGLEGTAQVGIAASLALAAATAGFASPRRAPLGLAILGTLVGVVALGLPIPENLLMHSSFGGSRTEGRLAYLGVGRSATVTVAEYAQGWRVFTNGLPESGVERPEVPRYRFEETLWLSLLPTAVRPEADSMLIIGLGAGKTLGATAKTVSEIDLIELEEEVVAANRFIPRASNPLDDPRVRLHVADARGALALSSKRWDAIVSQPSHPWTSGASHLYTSDFFELVRSRLEPGGVFVQWIGAGFVDDALFGSLMAALAEVFPHVHVFRPIPVALVFVASDAPIDPIASAPRALAVAAADFAQIGVHRPEDILASWSMDDAGVRAFAAGKPANTDDHNRLASARTVVGDRLKEIERFNRALAPFDALSSERVATLDPTPILRRMVWNGEQARARRIAARLRGADRLTAEGWMAYDFGQSSRAQSLFARALASDPADPGARAGAISTGGDTSGFAPPANAEETAAVAAERYLQEGDWSALRQLDGALARIEPGALLFGGAARARSAWRLEIGGRDEATEALAIVDTLLSRYPTPDHFYMRAKAGQRIGDRAIAWAALDALANRGGLRPGLPGLALALAQSLGPAPPESTAVERLAALVQAERSGARRRR